MEKRAIANTGISVSAIGLGTVKLGRNQGVKYPKSFSIPDDPAARALLDQAKDLGINLLDTAPAYGNSEERLGTLLKQDRKDWIIATKVGEEFTNGASSFDFSPKHTRYSIERSLKRLNTDIIDIVLVHSDGNDLSIINDYGTLDILADCKREGLIRAFGMSTKTLAGGLQAAEFCDLVMMTYNLETQDEEPILDYCAEQNKGAFIKKALNSGHITHSSQDQDPVKASLEFIFAHPGTTSAILGTINPEHLKYNALCFNDLTKG